MEVLAETEIDDRKTRFLLAEISHLKDLLQMPRAKSPNFALLTALDPTSEEIEGAETIAKYLLRNGLSYLCAWGVHCEEWHDLVDQTDVELDLPKVHPNDVVMTTWHSKDSLEEALWFFAYCASPSPGFRPECVDYIIACSPEYNDRVKQYFAKEFVKSA